MNAKKAGERMGEREEWKKFNPIKAVGKWRKGKEYKK